MHFPEKQRQPRLCQTQHDSHRITEPNEANNNPAHVTIATIPYIKGTSDTIAQILQPYDVRIAHELITTLHDTY